MYNLQVQQPSFKGTFLIDYRDTKPVLRRTFESSLARKGRQIFSDFEGKFDKVLYVMKNNKDYATAQFIKENNLKFKYMPDVDTSLRFSGDKPEKVSSYIKENKPLVINKLNKLIEYVENNRKTDAVIKNTELNHFQKIMKLLDIDMPNNKHTRNDGSMFVLNKKNGDALLISPKNKYGTNYVIYTPKDEKKSVIRCAIDKDYNILARFSSPAEIVRFKQLYLKALKDYSS